MKPIFKYTLLALLVIAVAGISVVGIAYAEGDDPPRGREGLAELLGLTQEELREEIQGGKTIQELADEAGVDLDAFHEEMAQNRQENLETRIEEALANGDISQDQADWLLEGLEKCYLNGPFFSRGGRGAGSERPEGMRGSGKTE
jgi:hypothetical protein